MEHRYVRLGVLLVEQRDAATFPPGPPASTTKREHAAAGTPMPFASSLVPGYASSGVPGTMAKPTIPNAMAAPSKRPSESSGVDTGCLSCRWRSPSRRWPWPSSSGDDDGADGRAYRVGGVPRVLPRGASLGAAKLTLRAVGIRQSSPTRRYRGEHRQTIVPARVSLARHSLALGRPPAEGGRCSNVRALLLSIAHC